MKEELLKEATKNEKKDGPWRNPDPPKLIPGIERETCPFFKKVGACRFGERCSRGHPYPETSTTVLLPGFYSNFKFNLSIRDECDKDIDLEVDEYETYQDFKNFYNDTLPEFEKFGRVTQFKVCANYEQHLRGNVYVEYAHEADAIRAQLGFHGRWYAKRQISCEFTKIDKWKNAICGMYSRNLCPKGKTCNFLHCFRNPGNAFWQRDIDVEPESDQSRDRRHGRRDRNRRTRSRSREKRNARSYRRSKRSQSKDRKYYHRSRSRSPRYSRSRRSSRYKSRSKSPRRNSYQNRDSRSRSNERYRRSRSRSPRRSYRLQKDRDRYQRYSRSRSKSPSRRFSKSVSKSPPDTGRYRSSKNTHNPSRSRSNSPKRDRSSRKMKASKSRNGSSKMIRSRMRAFSSSDDSSGSDSRTLSPSEKETKNLKRTAFKSMHSGSTKSYRKRKNSYDSSSSSSPETGKDQCIKTSNINLLPEIKETINRKDLSDSHNNSSKPKVITTSDETVKPPLSEESTINVTESGDHLYLKYVDTASEAEGYETPECDSDTELKLLKLQALESMKLNQKSKKSRKKKKKKHHKNKKHRESESKNSVAKDPSKESTNKSCELSKQPRNKNSTSSSSNSEISDSEISSSTKINLNLAETNQNDEAFVCSSKTKSNLNKLEFSEPNETSDIPHLKESCSTTSKSYCGKQMEMKKSSDENHAGDHTLNINLQNKNKAIDYLDEVLFDLKKSNKLE